MAHPLDMHADWPGWVAQNTPPYYGYDDQAWQGPPRNMGAQLRDADIGINPPWWKRLGDRNMINYPQWPEALGSMPTGALPNKDFNPGYIVPEGTATVADKVKHYGEGLFDADPGMRQDVMNDTLMTAVDASDFLPVGLAAKLGKGGIPGAGTIIGQRAKHFPDDDMVELRSWLDMNKPGMSESNKLDATGIGMHPAGLEHGYIKTVPDQDLALTKLPKPSATEIKLNKQQQAIGDEWDALREQDPLENFATFKARNQELFDKKKAVEWDLFDFHQKYKSDITGKVGENVTGSQAISNYPRIADMSIYRRRSDIPEGHVQGNELMISGESLPIMGHELGHSVSKQEGWPRGGNTQEMSNLMQDLQAQRDKLSIPYPEHPQYRAMDAQTQVAPYDRYQSLLDERIQRYTQYGVDKNLSADELAMYRLPDFLQGEKMRTGLDSLVIPQGAHPTVSEILKQQSSIGPGGVRFPDKTAHIREQLKRDKRNTQARKVRALRAGKTITHKDYDARLNQLATLLERYK